MGRKLKLNTNLIHNTLNTFVGQDINYVVRENSGCIIHRYVVQDNSFLDVYFNRDGSTSLSTSGKDKHYAELAMDEIIQTCTVNLPDPTRALYLKGFTNENLQDILGKLDEAGYVTVTMTSTDTAERYQVTNTNGENIKIHFFPNTGALNFQGKGYAIYNSILLYLDTLLSLDEVIESNLRANNIENITTSELKDSMNKAFVGSYGFLDGAIINIMSSSFFLTKIENDNLADYSWMVFPILKGVEGYIKKLLVTKGIRINKSFGEVFEKIATGVPTYKMNVSSKAKVSLKQAEVLEKCYNFLVANRHGVFIWTQ